MAEEKKEVTAPKKSKQKFIARKLKVINEMPNKAMAKAIAARILSHK